MALPEATALATIPLSEAGPLTKAIRAASVSDIHFYHPHTETPHIIESLDLMLTAEYIGTLDLLIFAGDVWDSLMNANDPYYFDVKDFIDRVLRRCKVAKTAVIVLEGTPSHDRKQSVVFDYVNINHGINANLTYVDKLDIVTINNVGKEQVSLQVLCIPDEWRPNPDDTWMEVTSLMQSRNLSKVDIGVMHGCFTYQLPSHSNAPKHTEERYLAIVRYFITIGHHHILSFNDRIFAQGSPERLKHREEGPKGFVEFEASNKALVAKFVENKNARIFRTFDCRKKELEESASWIEEELQKYKYPPRSRIRLQASKGSTVLSLYAGLKEKYYMYHWSVDTEDTASAADIIKGMVQEVYTRINITPSNIVELTGKWLTDAHYDPDLVQQGVKLLEGIVNES